LVLTSIFFSQGEPGGYGREGNPTWVALEEALGALERAEAVLFASGQAASMALMLALAKGRSRIVMPADGYYGARVLADRLRPHGAEPVPADQQDLAAVKDALAGAPSVLWAETPTNPLLKVADLNRLSELASAAGAPMIVDNTVATALLQRPLDWGAAASLYSLTKASSGHSDVILGAVVSRDPELLAEVRTWRGSGGGIAGPVEAWLGLRGLKTLPLRIERQSRNAQAIAEYLASHPKVRAVHYPGLLTGAARAVADTQMPAGFGPLLSFELDSAAAADAVVAASALILPATSLGGVESTWERRARWPAETAPDGLIRLSAGIEVAADLIADIDTALEVLLHADDRRPLSARRRPGQDRRGRGHRVLDHVGVLGQMADRRGHQGAVRHRVAAGRGVRRQWPDGGVRAGGGRRQLRVPGRRVRAARAPGRRPGQGDRAGDDRPGPGGRAPVDAAHLGRARAVPAVRLRRTGQRLPGTPARAAGRARSPGNRAADRGADPP
jgi:cystathionine beta-lyase/cystathionine gamma-synthase